MKKIDVNASNLGQVLSEELLDLLYERYDVSICDYLNLTHLQLIVYYTI